MQETSSVLGSGRSPGGGHGNPLQYSCLKNPLDRGAWWATVQGVTRVRHNLATKQQQLANVSPNLDDLDFYIFEFCPLTSCTIMFLNRAWVKTYGSLSSFHSSSGAFLPNITKQCKISVFAFKVMSLSRSFQNQQVKYEVKWLLCI